MNIYPYGKIVNNLNELEERMMPKEQYETYVKKEVGIIRIFHDSINDSDLFRYHDYIVTQSRISYQMNFDMVYGPSTVQESGCGILCIAHATNGKYTVEELANIAGKKGYCHPQFGTYHFLFDRLGAKRLKKANQVFKYLLKRKVVTALIKGHYINIVGIHGNTFLIEDSKFLERQNIPINDLLVQIKIAWAWI